MFVSPKSRSAMVIGNGNYSGDAFLPNPTNDANAIATALRNMGFTVFDGYDLTKREIDALYLRYQEYLRTKRSNDVAVIYYSGHGIQEDNVNYLIPIGSEQNDKQLVSLQNLIEGIADFSERRLVFLDACRSFPNVQEVVKGLMKTRGFKIDDEVITQDGLAEINVPKNTFVAFSSAPGKRAFDGVEGDLSPFTRSVVKHIESVDTPLPNMMARVRSDVAEITDDMQHTWDSSSLVRSFFFNPSSVLLLIGNTIGLIALCFAFVPYSVRLFETASLAWISIATTIVVLVIILFLSGLHEAYARLRGEHMFGGSGGENEDFRLWDSVKRGGTGGVFGGTIAALAIAVPYWGAWKANEHLRCNDIKQWIDRQSPPIEWPQEIKWPDVQNIWENTNHPNPVSWVAKNCALPPGELMTEIMIAAIFISTVLGVFGLVFSEYGEKRQRNLERGNMIWRNRFLLMGAMTGGLIAGIIIVPVMTLYFGRFDRPFLEPMPIVPGVVFATAAISFSIVNYSLDKFTLKRLGISSLAALASTIFVATLLGTFLYVLDQTRFIQLIFSIANDGFYDPKNSRIVQELSLWFGGLVYGVVFGPFLGLLIGSTLMLTPNRT